MVMFFCSAFHLKTFILSFIFSNILIITMIWKSMTDNSNILVNCVSVSIMHHFSWSCFLLHLVSLNNYGQCMWELRFWMIFSSNWEDSPILLLIAEGQVTSTSWEPEPTWSSSATFESVFSLTPKTKPFTVPTESLGCFPVTLSSKPQFLIFPILWACQNLHCSFLAALALLVILLPYTA